MVQRVVVVYVTRGIDGFIVIMELAERLVSVDDGLDRLFCIWSDILTKKLGTLLTSDYRRP